VGTWRRGVVVAVVVVVVEVCDFLFLLRAHYMVIVF
jgi:hypothetical protein